MPKRCIEPMVGWRSTQLNASLNVHLLSSHVPGEVGGALNELSLALWPRRQVRLSWLFYITHHCH